jgi:hypothetical protein
VQLLASVNRRAALSRRRGAATVSSACVVSYLSADGGIDTRDFDEKGSGSRIEEPRYFYFGLDFTDVIRNRPLWDPTTRQWRDKSGNVMDLAHHFCPCGARRFASVDSSGAQRRELLDLGRPQCAAEREPATRELFDHRGQRDRRDF